MFAEDSIELLKTSGINFAKFEELGIDVQYFGELMMMSGLVLNEDVKWVSFHSSYDFGYLVKTLTCRELPMDEPAFMDSLHTYFPCIYDVKVCKYDKRKAGLFKPVFVGAEMVSLPFNMLVYDPSRYLFLLAAFYCFCTLLVISTVLTLSIIIHHSSITIVALFYPPRFLLHFIGNHNFIALLFLPRHLISVFFLLFSFSPFLIFSFSPFFSL